jgi:hypothetical protein
MNDTIRQTELAPRSILFHLIRPGAKLEELSRARRLQLATVATLVALGFAAAWGAAAGSVDLHLALGNVVKVPMVVLLSAAASAPLGVVAWKLLGEDTSAVDLLLAHARGLLVGSMLLRALVPIVAIYYHSSAFAGPVLAIVAAFGSLAVGGAMFVRFMASARGVAWPRLKVAVPAAVVLVQAAALIQLIALASPILPDETRFRRGIDGLVGAEAP